MSKETAADIEYKRHSLMVEKWCLCNLDVEKRPNNPLVVCQCESIPIVLKFQNTAEALSYCQKHPVTEKPCTHPLQHSSLLSWFTSHITWSYPPPSLVLLLLGLTLLLWQSSPVLSVSWSPLFLCFASVVWQERTWERLRPTVKQTCWAVSFSSKSIRHRMTADTLRNVITAHNPSHVR